LWRTAILGDSDHQMSSCPMASPNRLFEVFNVSLGVGEELVEKRGQLFAVAQGVRPVDLLLALKQDASLAVLKDDVGEGVTARDLLLDFGVKIVLSIFGFPIAARQAVAVAQRAIRTNEPPPDFPESSAMKVQPLSLAVSASRNSNGERRLISLSTRWSRRAATCS
jgi:hypothetical protein